MPDGIALDSNTLAKFSISGVGIVTFNTYIYIYSGGRKLINPCNCFQWFAGEPFQDKMSALS